MKTIAWLIQRITLYMYMLSGFFLIMMMIVTLASVASRFVFKTTEAAIDFTFLGGIELIKFSLLFMVLFSLPYCVSRSQVIVDLFTEKMKGSTKTLLEAFYTFGFSLLGTGMCIRFYEAIGSARDSGETTQDLMIPLSYIYTGTAFATGMLAISALLITVQLIRAANRGTLA